MKLTVMTSVGYCSKCNAELMETNAELRCPQYSWWNRGHYRGELGGYGSGSWSTFGSKVIEVPDVKDPTWIPATSSPPLAGNYETLNSVTGRRVVLFKSLKSGGWWFGDAMWPSLVTHWRTSTLPQ